MARKSPFQKSQLIKYQDESETPPWEPPVGKKYIPPVDTSTEYLVLMKVSTGVRRDNPAWQPAIHDFVREGKYDVLDIQPIVPGQKIEEYTWKGKRRFS